MKKILIAGSCAFLLCLTSCASKKAPETESKTQAPQIELTEEQASDAENTEADSESTEENENNPETFSEADKEAKPLSSEDFPEPEAIIEEEIITLEPQEEKVEEKPDPVEKIESEEPPEISPLTTDEAEEAANPEENPEAADTPANTGESEDSELSTEDDITIIDNTQDSDGISGGIDITDEEDTDTKLSDIEKDITPSRSVTLKKFEYLDVTYPGTGWIYMGLTDNSKDLAYFGRKLGTKDTKFSLQARAAGKKIIHFYRNDPLTGQYLDDYLEVIITAENGSNKTHIAAPDYKLPVQKKEKPVKKVEETQEEETETKEEAAPKTSQPSVAIKDEETDSKATENPAAETTSVAATSEASSSNPATLLQEAQLLYNEKEYKTALSKLNQFFEYSTDNRDEALYLKGQILESKSDVRDIKGAIDAYSTLTKNYPASKLWDNANKRIIYLKRFYLEVR